ncbi:MAG: hypothetical protein GXY54_09875 [Deltaproteobacteria bacterium]|nr:hypothetical protein [Deltaproteobacteria bacterium]
MSASLSAVKKKKENLSMPIIDFGRRQEVYKKMAVAYWFSSGNKLFRQSRRQSAQELDSPVLGKISVPHVKPWLVRL